MINLLPPDVKENFAYARRNRVLLRWCIGVLLGTIGIGLVVGGGSLFLNRSVVAYRSLVADQTAELKERKLDNAQKQVADISNNLRLTLQVLSREVLFSELLTQIGSSLPRGSVLTDLNITQIEGGIDLQAAATDYQTASQIQINLEEPDTKIFSKVDLVSIQCQGTEAGGGEGFAEAYPCSVNMRAQFASNNQFLFINSTAKGTTP